jgi:cephalosporin hydroxylase
MERAPQIGVRLRLWAWKLLRRYVARRFHEGLVIETKNFSRTTWLGQPIWQNVLDLWTIQEAIAQVKPALLIEIGTNRGGSALFYAQLMDLMGTGAVVTIDIVKLHELDHPRIEFLIGSSLDEDVIHQVEERVRGAEGPVMVILDGDHSQDHVARELEIYAPMVTPGSLLLSQDGVIDDLWMFADSRPGPLPSNRDYLSRHPEFEYDRALNEQFILTHHPLGWMRRKGAQHQVAPAQS